MSLSVAVAVFVMIWGIVMTVAGFQIREPDLIAVGTTITSSSAAMCVFLLT